MADAAEQKIPPKPAPMTFGQLMPHYLAMSESLYDLKAKGKMEEARLWEPHVNALCEDLLKCAADNGFEKEFKDAIWNERGSAKRTL